MELTVEAVRSRIKGGPLEKEEGPDGTVYVVLGYETHDPARPCRDQTNDRATA
jgi:hypothetical protein